MRTQEQSKQPQPQPKDIQDLQRLNSVIGNQVMGVLGHPRDLCTVQVRQLWEDHYRVNVFTGMDISSARVAHSFFLLVDSEGKVVTSNPRITKQYEMKAHDA